MALPMMHLVAAQMWAREHGEYLDSPEFYLGAISPDAIHIRDGDDKSHKNEIHLDNWRRPNLPAVGEYWRAHRTPFDVGYGLHVLLDGIWATGFRADFPQMLLPNGKPDPKIYYNDTCRVDYELYDEFDGAGFFARMLRDAAAPKDHCLLSADEISQWRDQMILFYTGPCPRHDPNLYITRSYADAFLDRCVAFWNEAYEDLFLQVQQG